MNKFKLPAIVKLTKKSIRFPNDVIERIEKVVIGTGCTFSAFVIAAVRAILEDLEENK